MRILFTACPMYGHVNTVLPLALAARRAGYDVAFATGPDLTGYVGDHGLVAWPVGPTHAQAGGGPDADWMEYFATSADKRAADLLPRALGWRPDLVVTDETELAGPAAAAATGARHVVHGLGLMPPLRIWDAFAAMLKHLYARWNITAEVEAVRGLPYLEICPPALRPPGERIWPDAIPLRPTAGEPLPGQQLPGALVALPYADTVHLTLGTVFHGNRHVLQTALGALRDLPANLVVSTGPDTAPAALGPQPRHVVIVPYVPHTLLLPRCRLVVSQGGAGIMFGALAHGLPQLIIPQGAEQFLNAEACQNAGAALTLQPQEVTADAIAAAAGRLLADPRFTTAAAAVRAEIEQMPTAAAVITTILRR
jgi:UDP:flavonoid glycosyltransferase YjiC (YdhE family)